MRPLLLLSLSLCAATLSAQAPQSTTSKASSDLTDIHADIYADTDTPAPTFSVFSAMPSVLPSIFATTPLTAAPASPTPLSLESIVPNRLVVFYRGGIVPHQRLRTGHPPRSPPPKPHADPRPQHSPARSRR